MKAVPRDPKGNPHPDSSMPPPPGKTWSSHGDQSATAPPGFSTGTPGIHSPDFIPGDDIDMTQDNREVDEAYDNFRFIVSDDNGSLLARYLSYALVVPGSHFMMWNVPYLYTTFRCFHVSMGAAMGHLLCTSVVYTFFFCFLAQFQFSEKSAEMDLSIQPSVATLLYYFYLVSWLYLGFQDHVPAMGAVVAVPLTLSYVCGSFYYQIMRQTDPELYHWLLMPTVSWISNPMVWILVLPFVQSLSHLCEPVLPPRVTYNNHWHTTDRYCPKAGAMHLLFWIYLPQSFSGAVDEFLAMLRYPPIYALHILFSMNYLPEVKLQFDKVVEALWDSFDPAIEFMAVGGSTVSRDTPRINTKKIFEHANKMPLRGVRRMQSYRSLLYCMLHPYSVKPPVEEEIQRHANEQLSRVRLNVPKAMELLETHAKAADRIFRKLKMKAQGLGDDDLGAADSDENKENSGPAPKPPKEEKKQGHTREDAASLAEEVDMAKSYAAFMRGLLGDSRVDACGSFVQLLTDPQVRSILEQHLRDRYQKTAEKYLAAFPTNPEEFEAAYGDESSPWHQAAAQIRRNIEAIHEASEEERSKVPKIRFDNFNIRDARRNPTFFAR